MTHLFPPSFVGFDRLFNEIERAANLKDNGFPPHNIIKDEENEYTIEVAVAGYGKDDLSVSLDKNVLNINGEKQNKKEHDYVHRGISSRKFNKSFTLSEHVDVYGSELKDGILSIKLIRLVPEEEQTRLIDIMV